MNKDLHKLDDIFKNAYDKYEEEPSSSTWEKINSMLSKEDADTYKRKFIGWKRIAIMLFLLVNGLLIYDSRNILIDKPAHRLVDKQTHVPGNAEVKKTNAVVMQKHNDNPMVVKRKHSQDENGQPISAEKKVGQIFESELLQANTAKNNGELFFPAKKNHNDYKRKAKETLRSFVVKKNSAIHAPANKGMPAFGNKNFKDTGINYNGFLGEEMVSGNQIKRKLTIAMVNEVTGLKVDSITVPALKFKLMSVTAIATSKKLSAVFNPYWELSAFASSDWVNYKLDNDVHDNTGNHQDEREDIYKREKHEPSVTAGLSLMRQVTAKWGIKTGLVYSKITIAINPQEIYAMQTPDGSIAYKFITSSGYGYVKPGFGLPPAAGDSISSAKAQHVLGSLSIPLQLAYRYNNKKWSVIPSAGLAVSFITRATVQTEVNDALNNEHVIINKLEGKRRFYPAFIADVNLQYHYSNSWSFNLIPVMKYALVSVTKSNVVKTYPYSVGLAAGITCKF